MKKRLPIGESDFQELIEGNYYYVDKSLLIQEIDESGKIVLMTRPRRFGKTVNLSMLHYFFEKCEAPTDHLFKNLAIWEHEKYRDIQGQFPVIFVTFKGIFQSNYTSMIKKFGIVIAEEFEQHSYLKDSPALSDYEKQKFDKYRADAADDAELGNSLKFLTTMLYKHFNKKVVILIDEYDVPVQAAFVHGFYDQTIIFMKDLLTGALKDQKLLHKGVITGIMTLAKAGILTGLNNLDVYNLTHTQLADKFGFTEKEVLSLLTYYGLEDHKKGAKDWYNGYRFGKTGDMYNPRSVLKCIQKEGELRIYWANTSDNVILKRLIVKASSNTKSELELLLTGNTIEKTIDESIVYPVIDHEQNLIWSILLYTGYLTYTGYTINGTVSCTLSIPNKEIHHLYSELIRKLFVDSFKDNQSHELMKALTDGNEKAVQHLFQGFLLRSMSVYDIAHDEPEKSYHLFVLGLLVTLAGTYEVTSNRESGLGRYDILLKPKDLSTPAIIIEFKKMWNSNNNDLRKTAQRAIDQIIDKKYAQELYLLGYTQIIAYGIAFKGKEVAVSSCTLEKPNVTC